MLVAIIPAAAAILVAALTWFLSRQRDREAAWREVKLRHYEEFVAALSASVSSSAILSDKVRWAHACNAIHLIAPPAVLDLLYAFQDVTKAPRGQVEVVRHDKILTELLTAIRSDLGLPAPRNLHQMSVRFWSAPKEF